MSKREPKSRAVTIITVVGRGGDVKGRLEITSGNLNYYRSESKGEPSRWTLQQIIYLLENDLETKATIGKSKKLPKNKGKDDFVLWVNDLDGITTEEKSPIVEAVHSINQFDDNRKLEEGAFQIDSPPRKKPIGFDWKVRIGVTTAIYIVDLYIDKWLKKKRGSDATDVNVPISRESFVFLLRRWLAELDA